MRVTIGIPTYDTWKVEMAVSLLKGLSDFPHAVHLSVQRGCYIDKSREAVMTEAIHMGSDKVLFIDTDIVFPADAMRRIVEHTKTIIGGAYNEKRTPSVSTVKMDDGNGGYVNRTLTMPDAPFMCAAVGTGFLALHLPTIAERIAPPFFEYDHEDHAFMGEDILLCRKARAVGLEVWCDPTIPLKHVGEWLF